MKLKKLAASLLAAAMLFCGTATTAFADGGCNGGWDDDLGDILEGIEIGIPGIDIDDIDDIDIDVVKKWDRGTAKGEIKLPDPDKVNVKVNYGNDNWVSVDVDWDDEDEDNFAAVIPEKAASVTWKGEIDLEDIIEDIIADIKENITSSGGNAIQANGGFDWGDDLKKELKTILQKVITALTQSGTNMFGEEITGNDAGQWILASKNFTVFGGLKLTNTYTGDNGDGGDEEEEDTVSITVNKVWEGDENYPNARPEKITVRLLADNKVVEGKTLTLSAANNWTDKFTDLKKYKDNTTTQEKITYTVEEVEVLKGYDSEIKTVESGFTITNTYKAPVEIKQEYFDIEKVTKVWNDSEDLYKNRPSEITVQLYADNAVVAGKTLTLNAANNWTGNFENLPKYQEENGAVKVDSNNQPTEIKYTVKETNVPAGYEAKVTGSVENGFTITNTYKAPDAPEQDYVSITVDKVWRDEDGVAIKDTENLPAITVKLLADGKEVQDKTLTLSSANNWTETFLELKKYQTDENGTVKVNENNQPIVIEYTVKEVEVEGYMSVVDGFTIYNDYIGDGYGEETFSITVTKEWDDANNKDGIRPSSVTVELLALEDGELKVVDSADLNAGKDWTHTFTVRKYKESALLAFDDDSVEFEEIKYTVREKSVPNGYTVSYKGLDKDDYVVFDDDEGSVIIKNSHTPTKEPTPIDRDDDDKEEKDAPDLTVRKIDKESGKLITDKATFRIYKESGSRKLYYTGSGWSSKLANAKEYSTKNGKFTAYDLGAGTYYVEEVKAPSGYNLADDLKVNLTSKDKTVEFANSKAKQNPNTGALVLPLDLADAAVAAMTLGAAAWVISKSKK